MPKKSIGDRYAESRKARIGLEYLILLHNFDSVLFFPTYWANIVYQRSTALELIMHCVKQVDLTLIIAFIRMLERVTRTPILEKEKNCGE